MSWGSQAHLLAQRPVMTLQKVISASHASQARLEVKQLDIGPAIPPANGR